MEKVPDNKKIYFASDVHLGLYPLEKSREREKIFVKWLDEVKEDAHAIYLLGDIFDFWWEYKRVVPKGFTRVLGKIAEITDSGIPVYLFTGNHDVWIFDYLPQEIGVELHRKPLIKEYNGKKFYIAHGDGLGPGDKGFKLLKIAFTSKFLQWIFSRFHPNFGMWIGTSWSKNSRYSKGVEAHGFRGEEKELLVQHSKIVLEKEHYNYFVYGHRHIAIKHPLGNDSYYINLGDWITLFTYGVFDGKDMEVKKFRIMNIE